MKISSRKAIFAIAALSSSAGFASVAHAGPEGSFYYQNNGSSPVTRTAESFPSNYSKFVPTSINANTSVYGWADAPSGSTTYSGTTVWKNADNNGCSFTVVISYNSYLGRYLHTFNSAKEGSSSSTVTCSITASRNATTGDFTAYPVIGGF